MAIIYLTEQGSSLRKRHNTIILEKNGEELFEIEDFNIDTILIFGNIQVTTQAIKHLLKENIELAYLDMRGRLLGQLTPPMSKNISLRIKQYERYNDKEFVISTAKILVINKVQSQISAIRRYKYNHDDNRLNSNEEDLKKNIPLIDKADKLESILGLEGITAKIYFDALRKMCRKELKFKVRKKHPPEDPFNALLSLGYTLVANELTSILDAMGFDPYLGFYHRERYGRSSLAMDIIEEFRVEIVDRFVLTEINRGVFKNDDFELEEEERGIVLKKSAFKQFCKLYGQYITQTFVHDGREKNYRSIFKEQAEKMERHITGNSEYIPFKG